MYDPSIISRAIVITNRALVRGDLLAQLERVLRLDPYALILREKDLSDPEYAALARQVMALCEGRRTLCFLHARTGIAQTLGCRNIHFPLQVIAGMEETERLRLQEKFDRINVSCHSLEDIRAATRCGATQIILGTIYETDCKKGVAGRGLSFVREACRESSLPVYAIGGITPARLREVVAAGAAGGCMMSWFMRG